MENACHSDIKTQEMALSRVKMSPLEPCAFGAHIINFPINFIGKRSHFFQDQHLCCTYNDLLFLLSVILKIVLTRNCYFYLQIVTKF